MPIGPREAAHREHKEAVAAREVALKEYGKSSEAFKTADARLAAAIKNLPEPPPHLD